MYDVDAEVVPLLEANIRLNTKMAGSDCFSLTARPCLWGESAQTRDLVRHALDASTGGAGREGEDEAEERAVRGRSGRAPKMLFVASDVVYCPSAYRPLIQTVRELLELEVRVRDGRREWFMVMAHRHRHPDDATFFSWLLDAGLQCVDIHFPIDLREQWSSGDVRLFKISLLV